MRRYFLGRGDGGGDRGHSRGGKGSRLRALRATLAAMQEGGVGLFRSGTLKRRRFIRGSIDAFAFSPNGSTCYVGRRRLLTRCRCSTT